MAIFAIANWMRQFMFQATDQNIGEVQMPTTGSQTLA